MQTEGGRWTRLNPEGKEVGPETEHETWPEVLRPFQGPAQRPDPDEWGFVDSAGNVHIGDDFGQVAPFSEGLAAIEEVNGYERTYAYVTPTGERAFSWSRTLSTHGKLGPFHQGKAGICEYLEFDWKRRLVDRTGKTLEERKTTVLPVPTPGGWIVWDKDIRQPDGSLVPHELKVSFRADPEDRDGVVRFVELTKERASGVLDLRTGKVLARVESSDLAFVGPGMLAYRNSEKLQKELVVKAEYANRVAAEDKVNAQRGNWIRVRVFRTPPKDTGVWAGKNNYSMRRAWVVFYSKAGASEKDPVPAELEPSPGEILDADIVEKCWQPGCKGQGVWKKLDERIPGHDFWIDPIE